MKIFRLEVYDTGFKFKKSIATTFSLSKFFCYFLISFNNKAIFIYVSLLLFCIWFIFIDNNFATTWHEVMEYPIILEGILSEVALIPTMRASWLENFQPVINLWTSSYCFLVGLKPNGCAGHFILRTMLLKNHVATGWDEYVGSIFWLKSCSWLIINL